MPAANKNNALLARWAQTLDRREFASAVLAPDGKPLGTFREVDVEAHMIAERLREWDAGTVAAIQIGNSASWPALVLAAMRRRVIPLPLGRHIEKAERDAALAACNAGVLIEAGAEGG